LVPASYARVSAYLNLTSSITGRVYTRKAPSQAAVRTGD
jgi:hypothetical protein